MRSACATRRCRIRRRSAEGQEEAAHPARDAAQIQAFWPCRKSMRAFPFLLRSAPGDSARAATGRSGGGGGLVTA
eukprot:8293780-Pyramimonas_sp.AAC.1